MEGLDAEDVVLEFNQVNELTSDVVNGFQELIDETKTVVAETETDMSNSIESAQVIKSEQTGGQSTDQTTAADQAATQTTVQSTTKSWITIVIVIVVAIVGIIMLKMFWRRTNQIDEDETKEEETNNEETNNEETKE
jgi:predicted PurR-regulated permease PerM